jgi:hypothetical protein
MSPRLRDGEASSPEIRRPKSEEMEPQARAVARCELQVAGSNADFADAGQQAIGDAADDYVADGI